MKSNHKILIVDDDEAIRSAVKDVLDGAGFDTKEAMNGVMGLKIFSEDHPDLIVLDLMMPRMDGYMFLERLKQICSMEMPPRPLPKILVLTAMGFDQDLGLARNLGARAYVQKPFQSAELIKQIKILLGEA